jgi:hypothetical protein
VAAQFSQRARRCHDHDFGPIVTPCTAGKQAGSFGCKTSLAC